MDHQRLSKQGKKLFLGLALFMIAIMSTSFIIAADQVVLSYNDPYPLDAFAIMADELGLNFVPIYNNHYGNTISTAQELCSLTEDYYDELGLDKPYPVYVSKVSKGYDSYWNDYNNVFRNGNWVFEPASVLRSYLHSVTCEALPYVTECEDGTDNDNDGLIDFQDPGCWDDVNNPNTYNPNLDDESRADPECSLDIDCGDDYHENYCSGSDVYRTVHQPFCGIDLQCADNVYDEFVDTCEYGCDDGSCLPPPSSGCSDGLDNDNDGLFDMNDPGCESPADNDEIDCYSDNDCPDDVCAGGLNFCSNDDVYQIFDIFSCSNGGLNSAFCLADQEPRKLFECGEDSCEVYEDDYCALGDVYHSRTCYDQGCADRECFSETFTDSELVTDCDYGCDDSECLFECYEDGDCETGYICESNRCVEEPECQDGVDNDVDGLTDAEDPGCWDDVDDSSTYNPNLDDEGRSGIECCEDSECGVDGYVGDGFCKNGDSYKYYKEFTCSNPGLGSSDCLNDISEVLINTCEYGCNAGECLEPAECEDGTDNDVDGLIDAQDPGCWDDINDPFSYDPKNNEEASAGIECCGDSECGDDVFVGEKYCSGGDVYQDFEDFFCSNPGLGSAECDSATNKVLVDECEHGCKDGKCKGDDNDGDDWRCLPEDDCYEDEEGIVLDEISNTEGDYVIVNEEVQVGGVSSSVDDEDGSTNWKFIWIFILIILIIALIIFILVALVW